MNADTARAFLLKLPHVAETMQWGDNLVFWAADKAIGGRMFALINLDPPQGPARHGVVSFAAGPELSPELLETEGVFPAPYLARAHWVAVERWDVFRSTEWQSHLQRAHTLISAKLPARTRAALSLPPRDLKKLIVERRRSNATISH